MHTWRDEDQETPWQSRFYREGKRSPESVESPHQQFVSSMTVLEMIGAWDKGCSCADPGCPEQCQECTRGLIEAVRRRARWERHDRDRLPGRIRALKSRIDDPATIEGIEEAAKLAESTGRSP